MPPHAEHVFEVRREPLNVTSISRPNPAWRYTDKQGYKHRWHADGQPATRYNPSQRHELPTLRLVESEEFWCDDCLDMHADSWYECAQCGERVSPGTRADDTEQYIAGPLSLYIDGRRVTVEEWNVEAPPQHRIDDHRTDTLT